MTTRTEQAKEALDHTVGALLVNGTSEKVDDYLAKRDALIAAVLADQDAQTRQALDAAREALEAVEFPYTVDIWSPRCYWCKGYQRQPAMDQDYHGKPGHTPDCKRQKALALLAAPPAHKGTP